MRRQAHNSNPRMKLPGMTRKNNLSANNTRLLGSKNIRQKKYGQNNMMQYNNKNNDLMRGTLYPNGGRNGEPIYVLDDEQYRSPVQQVNTYKPQVQKTQSYQPPIQASHSQSLSQTAGRDAFAMQIGDITVNPQHNYKNKLQHKQQMANQDALMKQYRGPSDDLLPGTSPYGCQVPGRCGNPSFMDYPLPEGLTGTYMYGGWGPGKTCITAANDPWGSTGCVGRGGCVGGDPYLSGFINTQYLPL